MSVEQRLSDLGITLPEPARAVATYVPWVISGNLVNISGQLPMTKDGPVKGKVGSDLSVEEAAKAARLCAINIIAQIKDACGGDLERVRRIVKLGGFVNCTDDFTQQPQVINGASDLIAAIFGDAGKHARAAVGVNSLPLGVPVEIDALVEIA